MGVNMANVHIDDLIELRDRLSHVAISMMFYGKDYIAPAEDTVTACALIEALDFANKKGIDIANICKGRVPKEINLVDWHNKID